MRRVGSFLFLMAIMTLVVFLIAELMVSQIGIIASYGEETYIITIKDRKMDDDILLIKKGDKYFLSISDEEVKGFKFKAWIELYSKKDVVIKGIYYHVQVSAVDENIKELICTGTDRVFISDYASKKAWPLPDMIQLDYEGFRTDVKTGVPVKIPLYVSIKREISDCLYIDVEELMRASDRTTFQLWVEWDVSGLIYIDERGEHTMVLPEASCKSVLHIDRQGENVKIVKQEYIGLDASQLLFMFTTFKYKYMVYSLLVIMMILGIVLYMRMK